MDRLIEDVGKLSRGNALRRSTQDPDEPEMSGRESASAKIMSAPASTYRQARSIAASRPSTSGHVRMPAHGLLDFPRAEAVTGHIDDVIKTAEDEPGVLDKAPIIAPDRAQTPRRQRRHGHESVLLAPADFGAGAT